MNFGTRHRIVACPPAAHLRRLPPLRGALAALQGIIGANSNPAVYPLTRLPRIHPRPLAPRVGNGIPLTSIAYLPRLLRSLRLLGHPSTTESERPAVVNITSSGTLLRTAVYPPAVPPLLPLPRGVSPVPQGTTGAQHKHAVPTHSNPPTPTCPSGYKWYTSSQNCLPTTTTTPPSTPPKPSGYTYYKKRELSASDSQCPASLEACPVGLTAGDYECVDIARDLESCGGCVSQGKGRDCTAIKGVFHVGCENSRCIVTSCVGGYEVSQDGESCKRL